MVSLSPDRFGLTSASCVVVGVSGGVDSTVLLRLLHEGDVPVVAAHVNYGLRGDASEADEVFVRAMADEIGVPVEVRRVMLPEGGNRQEAAREARYAFFQVVAEQHGAEAVAVGHTQDDQAETVLLHLFRGTGPRGLAGMPPERPLAPDSPIRLIRPLLDTPRTEIEALARARGWTWREDASNADARYRRNALRATLLPEIEAVFGPGASARIAATAGKVRALLDTNPDEVSDTLSLGMLRESAPVHRHARYLDVLRQRAPEAPRRAAAVAELDALLDAQPGTRIVWPDVVVWRDREALVFAPPSAKNASAWPVMLGSPTGTPWGVFTATPLEERPEALPQGASEEVVDAAVLRLPLVLRRWRDGDRFRPLGMEGTKLVSDLLTERRVPPSERAGQLVLCAGDAIVWVVGHRLAHDARMQPDSQRAVRLTWTSGV